MVEIVGVLVVAEQHGVDIADVLCAQRGFGCLPALRAQLIGAGRIEGRVGQQAKAVDLDQRGGPPISVMDKVMICSCRKSLRGLRDGSRDRCRALPERS